MWISKNRLEEIKKVSFGLGGKDLEEKNKNLWESYNRVEKEKNGLQEKYNEVSKKVREQSKADMVFEAIKVILEGIRLESTIDSTRPQYNSMSLAQQTMRSCQPRYYLGTLGRGIYE